MDDLAELHRVLDEMETIDGGDESLAAVEDLRRKALDLLDRLPTCSPGDSPDRASSNDAALARAVDVFAGLAARLDLADL